MDCVDNQDVWRRPVVKSDSKDYYEYVILYVDYIISVYIYGVDILENIA